jgi:hypothetical protein
MMNCLVLPKAGTSSTRFQSKGSKSTQKQDIMDIDKIYEEIESLENMDSPHEMMKIGKHSIKYFLIKPNSESRRKS